MTAQTRTILVVDNDTVFLRLCASILRLRGFTVLTAKDGPEGLESVEARRGQIDLALVDIIMPGVDGWDVLREVRSRYPGLPVIMLTSIEEAKETVEKADDMGAAACLLKPIDPVSLITNVDRVLGKVA